MKLLTLNTHSIIEENYQKKLLYFADVLCDIQPDIIALQEVNQTLNSKWLPHTHLEGYVDGTNTVDLKEDNHIASVNTILRTRGINYNWSWIPIKNGYNKFDEGIGILSLSPIIETNSILLSKDDNYNNWRTRKAFGIKTSDNSWFYTVHFGWWDDEYEPFKYQWERFVESVDTNADIWILGDFNCTPDSPSYSLITNSGWYDCYKLSLEKDDGVTVAGSIAGWDNNTSKKRIDYIFTNKKKRIKSTKVIFNGKNKAVVSDHFGVLSEF
ncbi:MAG: endonuclease/exonuclease/phosphatase family protein [Clostridia bacterium]|nr:endonuclease/exonuclease/phosphatase family protein [Clostridia bacterium]